MKYKDAFEKGASLVTDVAAAETGVLIAAAIAGPHGAAIGAVAGPMVKWVSCEIIARTLSYHQKRRAESSAPLLANAITERSEKAKLLRGREFFYRDATGRSGFDELTEQAILAMVNAVDERRMPYLANFYAALYFEDIDMASVATLASLADALNYRAMCLMKIIGGKIIYSGSENIFMDSGESSWPEVDHIVAVEAYALSTDGLIYHQRLGDQNGEAIFGYGGILPKNFVLDKLGQSLFERMGLSSMPDNDPTYMETLASLERISASRLASPQPA